jgi:arylformamidase
MSSLIDISRTYSAGMAVFPIDTPYEEKFVARISAQVPVNVSRITMSTHCGTHADAPYHYDEQGACIGAVDLDVFVGPVRVIDAQAEGALCLPEHISPFLENCPPRVLLRLFAGQNSNLWNDNFRALAEDTVQLLAQLGVKLLGVDTSSVDPSTSKSLPAHMACRRNNIIILENLLLDHVEAGDYELIALPLKFENLDASPVRAVLRR